MVEGLGRTIQKSQELSNLEGIKITSNVDLVTHQQFADDTLLLGNSSLSEAQKFKTILEWYERASGQEVYKAKTKVFFLNTKANVEKDILRLLGLQSGSLPCIYLGLPLDKGTRRAKLWDSILAKLDSKLQSWKGKWLSLVGRIVLIHSVLSAIPQYYMSCLEILGCIRDRLIMILR